MEDGPLFDIIEGDALSVMREFPDEMVDTTVTSPPYWKKRDYKHEAQLGQENTPEDFIRSLADIFDEVRRATVKTGSLWVNIDDTYLKGQLLGIPWRMALEMQKRGWVLRSDAIWHKLNSTPDPAKNRLGRTHEYLFHFTKITSKYYFDCDSIREPHGEWAQDCIKKFKNNPADKPEQDVFNKERRYASGKKGGVSRAAMGALMDPRGRLRRDVISTTTRKFRGQHFAPYPKELAEPCILATCPKAGLVLDPFCGTATTGQVALQHGRRFIGVELSPATVKLAVDGLQKT